MKSSFEVAILSLVAVAGSVVAWVVDDKPTGDPVQDLSKYPLKEGEIRLETLIEQGLQGVTWVDARRQSDWEKDGLKGSIHLTVLSDAALSEQIAANTDALLSAEKIVIYCDGVHCTLSHDLAKQLQSDYSDLFPGEIWVLHGGITALQAEGMVTAPSQAQ